MAFDEHYQGGSVMDDTETRDAIDEIRHQMTLPIGKFDSVGDFFDPWEIFPAIYGGYSSDFDDMAILVLDNIRNGKSGVSAGEGLAHEMFREMLCVLDLCDYGTSPRGCFPNRLTGFNELLPALIEKWKMYRDARWDDNAPGT